MRGKTQRLGMMSERGDGVLYHRRRRGTSIHGCERGGSPEIRALGSLFAVGVKAADRRIRIGDEAVIVADGEVIAVGVAQMCGREMEEMNRGIAVKIRHRK